MASDLFLQINLNTGAQPEVLGRSTGPRFLVFTKKIKFRKNIEQKMKIFAYTNSSNSNQFGTGKKWRKLKIFKM